MNLFDFQQVVVLLQQYTSVFSFLSAFLGGTSLTLILSSMAGQGLLAFWQVFTFCFLGNLAADLLWFLVGRTALMERITDSKHLVGGYARVRKLIEKYKQKDLLIFILVKFVYGIRILTIILFGRHKYDFNKFLAYNTTAVLIITIVVTSVGWAAGKGMGHFVNIFENFKRALLVLIVVFLLMHFLRKLLSKLVLSWRNRRDK